MITLLTKITALVLEIEFCYKFGGSRVAYLSEIQMDLEHMGQLIVDRERSLDTIRCRSKFHR